uniref:Uncharacterized protein n=1 Tax=Strongyloides stercoralis TaxID=6248 RepID=A0A0K0EBU1_STRER
MLLFTSSSCVQDGRVQKNRNCKKILSINKVKGEKIPEDIHNRITILTGINKTLGNKTIKQDKNDKLNDYPIKLSQKKNCEKSITFSKNVTSNNLLLLDKTQSFKQSLSEKNNQVNEEVKSVTVPKRKCQKRKSRFSSRRMTEKSSINTYKSTCDKTISTKKLESLFKKFNDSSKDGLNEIKITQKTSSNTQFQFREKPPPEPIDDESSLILLQPNASFGRHIEKNEEIKVIKPDIIKRTKKEQKMVEGTWYNKILDENTLDDVPSDWDENKRPRRKKKPANKFEIEYDNIII